MTRSVLNHISHSSTTLQISDAPAWMAIKALKSALERHQVKGIVNIRVVEGKISNSFLINFEEVRCAEDAIRISPFKFSKHSPLLLSFEPLDNDLSLDDHLEASISRVAALSLHDSPRSSPKNKVPVLAHNIKPLHRQDSPGRKSAGCDALPEHRTISNKLPNRIINQSLLKHRSSVDATPNPLPLLMGIRRNILEGRTPYTHGPKPSLLYSLSKNPSDAVSRVLLSMERDAQTAQLALNYVKGCFAKSKTVRVEDLVALREQVIGRAADSSITRVEMDIDGGYDFRGKDTKH